jgi:hypothetical protein
VSCYTVYVNYLSLQHFFTLSLNLHDFREKIIEFITCFGFHYKFCLKHLSFRWEFSEILIPLRRSSCEVPVILVRFQSNEDFVVKFSKNTQISDFMKIRPVEAELFHADRWSDGWTDRHDVSNSHFSQVSERTSKVWPRWIIWHDPLSRVQKQRYERASKICLRTFPILHTLLMTKRTMTKCLPGLTMLLLCVPPVWPRLWTSWHQLWLMAATDNMT